MTTATTTATTGAETSKRAIKIGAGLLIIGVIIALIVAFASGGDEPEGSNEASSLIPQGAVRQTSFADVLDTALPRFESAAGDPAIGMDAPSFTASYFNNSEVTVTPGDGTPKIVLFLAHWCPHCQVEVTDLTEWFGINGVPTDVEIVAISTGIDEGAPNYPPATWLLREGWPTPVLRDSAQGDLSAGYGLSGYPYLVAIDGDGKVVSRSSGQLPDGQWDVIVSGLTR